MTVDCEKQHLNSGTQKSILEKKSLVQQSEKSITCAETVTQEAYAN